MHHFTRVSIILLAIFGHSSNALAGPWFTGPILAPSGHTIPRGHTNLETYATSNIATGIYDASGNFVTTPHFISNIVNPILSHGFTDWLDAQLSLPYVFNATQGVHYNRIADVSVGLGVQLHEQKKSTWLPDLRFVVQETFPTGKFDNLNPAFLNTDSTGYGSYATQVALNFQWLNEIFKNHYLRTRLSLSQLYSSSVNVTGFNTYGGSINTSGTIQSDVENDINIAFEFTLTQHWVAVFEAYFSSGAATRFNGILSAGSNNDPINIGSASFLEDGLAPAIEYNFNENIGLIGGVVFPVKGRNTSSFTNYVLALNAYW